MRTIRWMVLAALVWIPTAQSWAQTPAVVASVESELTRQRLQGVWTPHLLLTVQGAEAYPLAGRGLILERDTVIRTEGKRTVASGSFAIESGLLRFQFAERQPWDLETGPVRASVQYVFKVDGDWLTLCFAADDKLKPTDCTPGEGRQVVVYQRQQSKSQSASPQVAVPKSATPE